MILAQIQTFPLGYSEVLYNHKKYGVTRTDFNQGKSIKIYAEELGGSDFISLNYYQTAQSDSLKACEMPVKKVEAFLNNYQKIMK